MNTLTRIAITTLVLAAGVASARAPVPDNRAAAANSSNAATQLNAPLNGRISATNLAAGTIAISGQTLRIGEPYVALIDKRPGNLGLTELKDLRPGMAVRYRTDKDIDGALRVVELWLVDPAVSR